MPIKHHGRLVAVITGFSREQRALAQSQMDIIRPLGELAGVALYNARKYRQKYKMAAILQERLMPSSIPEVSGLDIGHKFLPARGVGGDYYDFIKFSEGKIGIIVGDVAGSDVEAAEYTTMGKYVLRAYAKDYSSAADVLAKTNDMVCEDTRTEMFISLFYGIIDVERGKLRYASAGCEPAVLYKAKTKTVTSLAAEGMLLGIKRGTTYVEQEVDIEPGDILLLHTDGLPEANVGNERFGTHRVHDVVKENAKGSAQTMVDNLYGALIEFGHGRITDDVAMVAVKVL
jgi:sigma-B regulation protein RsbU (phosphoserine phosphatase)